MKSVNWLSAGGKFIWNLVIGDARHSTAQHSSSRVQWVKGMCHLLFVYSCKRFVLLFLLLLMFHEIRSRNKKRKFNARAYLKVWSLMWRAAAFILANNVRNKHKARLSLLSKTYVGSHRGLSPASLWCSLRSIPAYWGSTLQGSSWSAWFRCKSPPDQCQVWVISHCQRSCAFIQQISNSPKTSRCVCVVRVSLQSCVIVSALKCGRSSPRVWTENKSTMGNWTFKKTPTKRKKTAFIKSMKREPAVKVMLVTVKCSSWRNLRLHSYRVLHKRC